MRPFKRAALVPVLALTLGTGACATLQQIAALRRVDFEIDRVTDLWLAGIEAENLRSLQDLSFADAGRIAMAVGSRDVPLEFRLHLRATNPEDNATSARLVRMGWTLFLEERETLSGVFEDEVVLPPGEPTDVRIRISLNLLDFFESNAAELVDLALGLTGARGEPTRIALRATPEIDTPLGPIRYPEPFTIVNREVGR